DLTGLDDLVAVMALSRHLGQGKYASGLAAFPIEDLAVTKAFEVLPRLDGETCRGLAARLDALPPFPGLAEALRAEQAYFPANYPARFAALDGDALERSVRDRFGFAGLSDEARAVAQWISPAGDPAERMLEASGGHKDRLIALADEVLEAFDTLAAIADGVADDPADRLTALRAAAESNPLLADELRTFDLLR